MRYPCGFKRFIYNHLDAVIVAVPLTPHMKKAKNYKRDGKTEY